MTALRAEPLWGDYMDFGPSPALPKRLLLKGWEKEPSDFCWMDCDKPGHNLRLPSGWEITLCSAHIKQLDRAAEEAGGYSKAAPPRSSRSKTWPWARWKLGVPPFRRPGLD